MSQTKLAKIARIDTFDMLRGYFLIVILFNHLAYYPSGLDFITGRGVLYVSSAEGFFLISGIILGIVRGQKLLDKPWKVGAKLLLKRSLQLYVISVTLTLFFTIIGWILINQPGLKLPIATPGESLSDLIWNTLTYQYAYGWADFLRYYAVFIGLAPLALWLLRRRLWYVVLLISAAIWSLFSRLPVESYWAPLLSWQIVFFSGMVIGFHWPQLRNLWHKVGPNLRIVFGCSLVLLFVLSTITSAALVFGHRIDGELGAWLQQTHRQVEPYFYKDRLPIYRLALGAIWFWALYWLVRRYESTIKSKLGWLLLPLGKNSLYVYTIQAFIVFFMHFIVAPPTDITITTGEWIPNFIFSILALILVWLLVKKQFLFRIIPR